MGLRNCRRSAMKSYFGSLATVLVTGTLFLGMGIRAGAQQYPQQPQDGPPQGGPTQQQGQQNDGGAARISFLQGDVSTQHNGSTDWAAATINTPVVTGDHISTGQNG